MEKKQYEQPSIIGPIQCLKGTTGFQWNTNDDKVSITPEGLAKKVLNAKLRAEDFGGVVANMETDQVFELNCSGFDILIWLKDRVSIDDLAGKLIEKYEVDRVEAALDINEFLLTAYRHL